MKIILNKIQLKIIYKLFNKNRWGDGHMLDTDVRKGFPSGIGDKIEASLNDLVRSQILLKLIKSRETHYSLNKNQMKGILRIIGWYNDHLALLKNEQWTAEIEIDIEDH